MSQDILPDSRAKSGRGARLSVGGVFWIPIYCIHCGALGGSVPEENTTFVSWLCNKCAPAHGLKANEMAMPDEVFWEKVIQEQLGSKGRLLTPTELVREVETDASPLATLLRQGHS